MHWAETTIASLPALDDVHYYFAEIFGKVTCHCDSGYGHPATWTKYVELQYQQDAWYEYELDCDDDGRIYTTGNCWALSA